MQNADGAEAPTRRRFLKWMMESATVVCTLPLVQFGLPEMLLEETVQKSTIRLSRIGRSLEVTRPSTVVERVIDYHWDKFFVEHQVPTPATVEGFGTDLGLAAVAIGQLKVRRDDALLSLTEEQRQNKDYGSLMPRFRNVVRLMEQYDQADLETLFPMDSLEFAAAFSDFLKQHGLDGVVAMKSASDFGRIGNLFAWDKLAERWSKPMRVLVANSAWERTFYNWNELQREYEDFHHRTEQVLMGWVIETSRDMWPESELGGFYRWVEEEVESDFEVVFPRYERNPVNIQQEFVTLGQDISSLLASDDFGRNIQREVSEGIPDAYNFESVQGVNEMEMNNSLLPTYFLNRFGIPLYRDPDVSDFQFLVDNSAETEIEQVGFPFGRPSHHYLLSVLAKAGVIRKGILSVRRNDGLEGVKNGIFYMEDFAGEYIPIPMLCGMVTWDGSRHVFIFYNADGGLQSKSVNEMTQLRQSIYERLVIFS